MRPCHCGTCRLCWLVDHRPEYASKFGEVVLEVLPLNSKPESLDCIYRGEHTTERVPCIDTCRDGTKLVVQECELFGKCTIGKRGAGIEKCCRDCKSKSAFAQPRGDYPTPTIRHLLYHVYPVSGNNVWQKNVAQLMQRMHLFNGRRVLGIVTGPGLDPPEHVKQVFNGTMSEYVIVENNPDLREVSTLLQMLSCIQTTDSNHCFFFGHAKGVTRPSGSSAHRWTEVLYETCLDRWPLIEKLLTQYPCAGPLKRIGKWFADSSSKWHYSGTFWWSRCDELFKRDWQKPERKWWGAESYPSTVFKASEAGAIFYETRDDLLLYLNTFWRDTLEPAYSKWKAEMDTPKPKVEYRGLNLGCGPYRAEGWLNTDIVQNALIQPDQLLKPGPLPFPESEFQRVYLGHVLEHIPWSEVPTLLSEIKRVLKPGGDVCVVGPDVYKSLAADKKFIEGVLEDDLHHQDGQRENWDGARHHWNCYDGRIVRLLEASGFLGVEPQPINKESLSDWPVVDYSQLQCAVTAKKGIPAMSTSSMDWAYGVTTVPERRDTYLPRTLASLAQAGFDKPRLFVDGCESLEGWDPIRTTLRYPRIRTHGNWILGMLELYLRNPSADRYAMFQDDFVTVKNLKEYLELTTTQEKSFWNLMTFPGRMGQDLCRTKGWCRSTQLGKGAVGLVFDNEGMKCLLSARHMVDRVQNRTIMKRNGWEDGQERIDGGVVDSMKKAEYTELIHSCSLVSHIGDESSMGHMRYPGTESFPGESVDIIEFMKK